MRAIMHIDKVASQSYYTRNRARILARQRAYRQQNSARIKLQQMRYRARVARGSQVVRTRTSVGNSYHFTGGTKFASDTEGDSPTVSIPGVKGLKVPRISTPRPAVMGTKLQPMSMGGNNRAILGLKKQTPLEASLKDV